MQLAIAGSKKTWAKSPASIIIRKDTMQGTVLSPKKIFQKMIDNFQDKDY